MKSLKHSFNTVMVLLIILLSTFVVSCDFHRSQRQELIELYKSKDRDPNIIGVWVWHGEDGDEQIHVFSETVEYTILSLKMSSSRNFQYYYTEGSALHTMNPGNGHIGPNPLERQYLIKADTLMTFIDEGSPGSVLIRMRDGRETALIKKYVGL